MRIKIRMNIPSRNSPKKKERDAAAMRRYKKDELKRRLRIATRGNTGSSACSAFETLSRSSMRREERPEDELSNSAMMSALSSVAKFFHCIRKISTFFILYVSGCRFVAYFFTIFLVTSDRK